MEININLGDELSYVDITYPHIVPVTRNDKHIGEATILSPELAEIKILNQEDYNSIRNIIELGVSGNVSSRDGDIITGFNLSSVSLQWKESLKIYPKKCNLSE